MNVFLRSARNTIAYAAVPFVAARYMWESRHELSVVMADQLDPMVAGAVAGEIASWAVSAAMESAKLTWSDTTQRNLGRVASTVIGAGAGYLYGDKTRWVTSMVTGAGAGAASNELTSHVAPNWGHLEKERAAEASGRSGR